MLPSIGNLFRNTQQVTPAPGATPPAPQPAPNNAPNGQPGSSMQLQNGNPGQQDPNANPGQQQNSPLDSFADLWQPTDPAKAPSDPFAQPLLATDPAKLSAAVKSHNFLQDVPQELMQKVMAGNDPQALMDLINHVGQSSLGMALQLSTAASERMGQTAISRLRGDIPNQIKDWQMQNAPVENPALNHPAAQPLLAMVKQQIRMKNPNLSVEQINSQAVQYLTQFAGVINPQSGSGSGSPANPANPNGQDTDWEKFLGA